MVKIYSLILIPFLTAQFSFANETDSLVTFSDAIKMNVKEYVSKSNSAYNEKDYVAGEKLFSDFIQNSLVGTQFDDFSFKKVGKGKVALSEINMPVIIFTYATWCIIEKGEIPAINKLATEYKGKVKIIVVFWDTKENMKKMKGDFNSNVELCYAHDTYNDDTKVVTLLKKTLGFPTSYYIDSNKIVMDIRKHKANPDYKMELEQSFASNYSTINTGIEELLYGTSIQQDKVVSN